MKAKPLLIYFHIHHRRTGVTSSVESVLPYFEDDFDTYLYGNQINWHNTLSLKQLKKKIKTSDKVIVHVHRNNELLRALWLRLIGYQFKLVVTRHAATYPSKLTLKLMRKADERIGLIDSMKQLPFKVNIIGHGVNTEKFSPNKRQKIAEIKQPNFIVVAGRVRPKKGHQTFINAMVPLLKQQQDWAAVIVGKVDDKSFVSQLEKTIQMEGVESQVYFIDETNRIEHFYQASKATVVPSHSEGFSLVCLEAMACESITIATRGVGIHSKVIEDQKTGFLFEAGNHKELQAALTKVIQDTHTVSTKKARAFIKEYWSAKQKARELKDFYLRLIENDI